MSNVIIESVRGTTLTPLDDVFLKDRKIFFTGEVNDSSCNELAKKLMYMESMDSEKSIYLFINTPGGDVKAGLIVYDTIKLMKSPVTAVVTGIAASMGSIILMACEKERRLMLPNSRVMIHDCCWGQCEMGGKKPFEIEEELKQLVQVNEKLVSILAEGTGKTKEEISAVTKNDSYFSAKEAVEFGLVGSVLDRENFSVLMRRTEE